jgi:hypothetical protein
VKILLTEILPEMFQLAADGKLTIETVNVSLGDIEQLWDAEVPDGKAGGGADIDIRVFPDHRDHGQQDGLNLFLQWLTMIPT